MQPQQIKQKAYDDKYIWLNTLLMTPRYLTMSSISSGIIAWLFSVAGPLLIVLKSAEKANLDAITVSSWIFSIYFIGGILTLSLSIYYRQPISVAFSIPGAVIVGTSLVNHSFEDVIGAYIITGIIILIIGLSGLIEQIMKILPMPIMMGMVSAVLLPFVIGMILSIVDNPILNGITLASFLIFSLSSKLTKKIPPILGTMVVAGLLLFFLNLADFKSISFSLAQPQFFKPSFNFISMGELVFPLLLAVIAIQNAQGIAVLKSSGYSPPINAMTNWSGIGSIANAIFGAHSACIAGPMNAIMAAKGTGPKEGRYTAGIVLGVLWLVTGVLAPMAVIITETIPTSLISLLGGLAMLNVLTNSLQESFSSKFKLGALFSFVITLSGITILNIGSPFWGLVGGTIISIVLERKDFYVCPSE